jgi:PAS domain S-box-containing protein
MLDADMEAISNPKRLDKLRELRLLDTPADPAFDRLTRLAARILKAPIALVSLIDEKREFFKSQIGLDSVWASILEAPYGKHVVMTQSLLIIEDTRKHPVNLDKGGMKGSGILAYAGIPLVTSDGWVLGTLCVIDTKPRSWTTEEIAILDDLSKSVMTEIELRSELIERERIETALRKSEQHLQAVIDSAPVIVYAVDQDGLITMTEGKGLEAIGVAANRLVGQSVFEVYHDRPEVIEAVHKALHGQASTIRTTQDFPQGRVHYEAAISPLVDGEGDAIGAIGVLVDITDRVIAEQTLERSVQRLILLRRVDGELGETLDPDSVLTIAMDTALRASRAEHGFIGLIEGDKLRLMHSVGSYTNGSVWDSNVGVVGRALQTRKPQLVLNTEADPDFVQDIPGVRGQMAIPLVHRDHLIGVLNLKTRKPELFTREAFEFLGLIASRVTVAIANAQLYQVSQQQLEELHKLYMRVSELEQLKTDMIRIAAHDLRNPLGIVTGYADLLLTPGDTLTEEDRSFVETISKSGRKMLKIINDILSLQRIEAMQTQGHDKVTLNELIGDLFGGNQTRAQQKKQKYYLKLTELPVQVNADPAQLREAIDNLIGNAIKYTPDEGSVTVSLETDGDRAIFEVQDTGFGIPQDQQDRLFQPFFRASNAKASAIEGTGLGLHLVKNIIERHGGRMRFRSTLGEGSTFGFELPLCSVS